MDDIIVKRTLCCADLTLIYDLICCIILRHAIKRDCMRRVHTVSSDHIKRKKSIHMQYVEFKTKYMYIVRVAYRLCKAKPEHIDVFIDYDAAYELD